jgi:glycerol-3-phosphate acyltransferase PlsY
MSRLPWRNLVLAGAASYALGSLSPAAAAARLRKADLRGTGSGNPGATNAARTMGVPVGVAVGALDIGKGYLPVWYFRRHGTGCAEVAGLAAVLGHVTSPLLKGRGGKGVATSLGSILALEPIWAIPVLTGFGLTVGATRQMGIGSVVGSLTLMPTSIVVWRGRSGVAFALGMSAIVVYRHRRNLRTYVEQVRLQRTVHPRPPAREAGAALTDEVSVESFVAEEVLTEAHAAQGLAAAAEGPATQGPGVAAPAGEASAGDGPVGPSSTDPSATGSGSAEGP